MLSFYCYNIIDGGKIMDYQPFTKVYLLHNIKIDASYNHEILFEQQVGKSEKQVQYEYFYSKKFKELSPGTYQRKNKGVIKVPFLMEDIADCTYIMWKNLLNENGTSPSGDTRSAYEGWIYAFVTKIDYANPTTSYIYYQIDVYQTYLGQVSWKPSFIERQHVDRWTQAGEPTINTLDEGLDYGDSYQVLNRTTLEQIPGVAFLVIGTKVKLSNSSTELISSLPTQLYYHVIPIAYNTYNYIFQVNGTQVTWAYSILNILKTDSTFVNSCVSVYITPFLPISSSNLTWTITPPVSPSTVPTMNIVSSVLNTETLSSGGTNYTIAHFKGDFIPSIYEIEQQFPKYSGFPTFEESKLYMYPYSFTELSTDRGSVYPIKLEYVKSDNLKIGILGTISYRNKLAYLVKNYMTSIGYNESYNPESGIYDNTSNELPVIDDYTASYLQANSNQIKASLQNAEDTKQLSFRQAETSRTNAGIQMVSTLVNNGLDTATKIAEAKITGDTMDIAKAITSGVNTLSTGFAQQAIMDNNYAIAVDSANVDYVNSVRSILAKRQDAEQIPPSVSTMGNEYIFDTAYNRNKIYLYQKSIQSEYVTKLTGFFKTYGYLVNVLEQPNFHSRESWNYIKMTQANVFGNIPMDDLMTLRGIFQKGITLWHGDYVGDYDRSNNETSGVAPVVGTNVRVYYSGVPSSAVTIEGYYYDEQTHQDTPFASGSLIPKGSKIDLYATVVGSYTFRETLINGSSYASAVRAYPVNQNSTFIVVYE